MQAFTVCLPPAVDQAEGIVPHAGAVAPVTSKQSFPAFAVPSFPLTKMRAARDGASGSSTQATAVLALTNGAFQARPVGIVTSAPRQNPDEAVLVATGASFS